MNLVLKMPAVWLIAIVIIAANSGFWATYLFTPYASEVFLLSVAMGGLIGVARNWINPLAPFISGFVADRFGISKNRHRAAVRDDDLLRPVCRHARQ